MGKLSTAIKTIAIGTAIVAVWLMLAWAIFTFGNSVIVMIAFFVFLVMIYAAAYSLTTSAESK